MEKCKYCQEELAENSTVCPACGKDNAEEIPETEAAVPAEAAAEETAPAATVEEAAENAPEIQQEASQPVQMKEGLKATPGKVALMAAAVVVLLAVVVALLAGSLGLFDKEIPAETTQPTVPVTQPVTTVPTVPASSGLAEEVNCKSSYSADAEAVKGALDTVVATAGDCELTLSQLQIFYWMQVDTFLSSDYGYYMLYAGLLDYTQPLDQQICALEEGLTWQQFLLKETLNSWRNYAVLSEKAHSANMELTAEEKEYLDNLEATLNELAASYGRADAVELLESNFGPGVTVEEYSRFQEMLLMGNKFFDEVGEGLDPTQEELEAYFAEHESEYAQNGITKDGKYVDVRHILFMPATDENGAASEEAWAECEKEAQAVLDQWKQGEATEESFGQLANEYTDDGNDANGDGEPDGGLYENVYVGQMVEPFETWCFDDARVPGDTGLVETGYGWHVMYFVDSEPIMIEGMPEWEYYTRQDMRTEQTNRTMDKLLEEYPMQVDYSKILLGVVNLAG